MLIDTSGFFCIHDKAERHHNLANEINQELRARITTNYILAEYVALAFAVFHKGRLRLSAKKFLKTKQLK